MKLKLPFLLCAALLSLQASAQQLHLARTRFIGGPEHEQAFNLASTTDHGIVFTGYTMSGASGVQDGDIPGNWMDTNSVGTAYAGENLIVGKLDSNMQLSWVKVYGGTQGDGGGIVKQTADGGYAVLGTTESNDRDVSGNHGSSDMWLLKLDAQGNKLWQHCYGGPASDGVASFLQTPDKGFLLLGSTNGAGGDVPFVYVNSPFTSDWLLVKTDSLGNVQWSKTIGGTGYEYYARLLAANNNYYIVGGSESYDHECSSWVPPNTGPAQSDYVVLALDTSGNWLGTHRYGGNGMELVGDALWDPRDSTIMIVGSSGSPGGNPQNTNNSLDEWLVKVRKDGSLAWSAKVGDNSSETGGMGIAMSPDGGYVTVCETQPDTPLPPGHIGNEDFWVFKFDNNGQVVSNKIMGGMGNEETGFGIARTKNGYCTIGTTALPFIEGTLLDTIHGIYPDIYVSELEFWPTAVSSVASPETKLNVYPNPAQNSVRIALPQDHHKGLLSVYDISGKLIFSEAVKADTGELSIDLSSWVRGNYIAEWLPKDGVSLREKFIVY